MVKNTANIVATVTKTMKISQGELICHLFVWKFVTLFVPAFFHLLSDSFICLCVLSSAHLSGGLYICLIISLFLCLFSFLLFVHLSTLFFWQRKIKVWLILHTVSPNLFAQFIGWQTKGFKNIPHSKLDAYWYFLISCEL